MPPPSGRSGGGGRSRWIPVVALTLMLMAAATMMHLIPNTEPSIVTATPVVVKSTRAATTSQPTSTRPRRTRRPSSNPAASGETVPNGHALLASWNEPYQETRRALRERQGSGKPLTTHTFYTIDCTHHSLWQSMTLEASWEAVGQGGFLSRVTSGCESAQHKQPDLMRHTFEDPEHPKRSTTAFGPTRITGRREDPRDTELCPTLLDCFGIFFVPAFHVLPNGDYYAPYNRPNGIWYWLNNTEIVEDVLVLLDPDMIYLSRLRGISLVKPGAPAAMYYNYMDFEKLGNYDCPLCPKPGSFNRKEYAVGPPWMIRSEDLKLIMSTWIQLVPMLREKDKGMWIVEMVAYSVACAFHSLPHTLLYKSMVDNVAQDKAWVGEFIAGHENTDMVVPLDIPPKEKEVDEPIALLHYCYTWEVGETNPKNAEDSQVQHARQVKKEADNQKPVIDYFHWSKYRTPSDWPGGNGRYAHNVFSCDCPLLQEFHTPWAFKGSNRAEHQSWLRNAMFMHLGLPRINYALGLFKAKYCSPHGTNMKGLIRTSHPSYWVSNYVITNYSKTSEGGVTFVPASDTTTRAEGAALPTNMQKVD